MNETDYIKEALLKECVHSFVEAVLDYQKYDSKSEQQIAVQTWSQAVLAAISIKNNVEVINAN